MIELLGFVGMASIFFFIFTRSVANANRSKLDPVRMNSDILMSKNYERGVIRISSDRVIFQHSMIMDKEILFVNMKAIRPTFLFLQRVSINYFKGTTECSLKFETYQAQEIVQLIQSCIYLFNQKNELQNGE